MEKLNNKIKNGRTEKIDDAQMVGNYGYDSTIDKLRRLTCDTNGALHVDVHGGSAGSGDLKCRTDIANPATSTFVKCNADGTLEMTAELSSAGLATSAIQTDGTQKARCMGGETDGTQQQLLVSNLGVLQVLDSEVFGKTSQIANQTTLSNTNEATIIANQTNGSQKATVGNTVGDGSGTAKHLLTNANGELLVNFGSATTQNVNCFGKDGGGTARELLVESNGAFVLGGGSSSALGNTATDGSGDAKFLLCDAQGHLQVDIVSGGGGGGGSTTFTTESKSVPDNTLTVIGDNSNAYIDTNGGSKFTVAVSSATFTGSPAINIEWSSNTSFSSGTAFVCNGYIGGSAVTTPVSLQSVTRLDGTTLAIQGISAFENIPARYARITIEQTSGGAITYVGNTVLSP